MSRSDRYIARERKKRKTSFRWRVRTWIWRENTTWLISQTPEMMQSIKGARKNKTKEAFTYGNFLASKPNSHREIGLMCTDISIFNYLFYAYKRSSMLLIKFILQEYLRNFQTLVIGVAHGLSCGSIQLI